MPLIDAPVVPVLVAGGCGAVAALTVATACITALPPALPQLPTKGPTIVLDEVQPPADEILAALPSQFAVPVQLDLANAAFEWDVFVDYDPVADPQTSPVLRQDDESPADGGAILVTFSLDPTSSSLDPSQCHVIEFLVASAFTANSEHTWDPAGGDIVTWLYNPGGGSGGCPVYDAGALQDGAFPTDAATDVLPVIPVGDP